MPFILAAKELAGNIYITRLPKAINDQTPGVPDNWYLVGPGTRPSIQEYSGTQFILTFEYLSHLFCRVVDIATWPPTQVNPVQTSGGPNPPTPFTYNIQLAQDSLTAKLQGQDSFGLVASYFNPPYLQQPLLFVDPLTLTYSVTLTPLTSFHPEVPANVQAFFRLYNRPFPYTGGWTLIMDWTLGTAPPWFTFTDTHIGSLRYQYAATWGSQFSPTAQFDPNQHMEGVIDQNNSHITVDSTTQHASLQLFINESFITVSGSSIYPPHDGAVTFLDSFVVAPNLGPDEMFLDEAPEDAISLSRSLLGNGGNTFFFAGTSQAFINVSSGADDVLIGPFTASGFSNGGNALPAFMG